MRHNSKRIQVGQVGIVELPHSEVCMHMRIAGKVMYFKLISTYSVQLYRDAECLEPYSGPITTGEGGIYQDEEGFYYYPAMIPTGDPAKVS